jgi:hypothetical protein
MTQVVDNINIHNLLLLEAISEMMDSRRKGNFLLYEV